MSLVNKKLIRGLIAVYVIFLSSIGWAATSKGVAEVDYSGFFGPGAEEKRQAIDKAKLNALERYVTKSSRSKVKMLQRKSSQINAQMGSLILDSNLVDEKVDKDTSRVRIVIKVEINEHLLNSILAENDAPTNGEGDYLSFVFVAREQSSVKSYQDRKVARKEIATSDDGVELESASVDGMEYQTNRKSSKTMVVGGSTTRKADVVEYRVSTVGDVNIAMTGVFSEAGFEVVEADYLEDETGGLLDVSAFKRDYAVGNDVDSRTLKSAVKGLKMLEIPYFAVGTLDISMQDKNPDTGLVRVYVTVTGQVKSLKKRFPKTVASSGPVQYAGEGPNVTVARTNALLLAAKHAAVDLTEQLRVKNIN